MKNDRQRQMDECYNRLRRLLLHGQIPEGQRITETQWASKFSVHRGSLREAMGILAHEGLLERGDGGGFFVPELGYKEVREIIETRLAIESGAIRLAMMKSGGMDAGKLREVCDSMQQMIDQEFDLGFAEADRRFHECLVQLAKNPRLERVYMNAPLGIHPSPQPDSQIRKQGYDKTLSEHIKLCDMIEHKQLEDACQILQKHLLASIEGFETIKEIK